MSGKSSLAGHLASAGAYFIFGFNIVFCKDIANAGVVSPIVLFTLRAIGASLLFWAISFFLPKERIEKGDMWKIALASFLGLFMPQLTFLGAITMTTSIDSSVLGTLSPIFTMLFAAIFLKEPITFKKAAGVAISFAGILFLIYNSAHAAGGVEKTKPMGVVLMLLNGITFGSYLGIFRPLISKYNVVTFMKWMFLFSVAMSLPFSARGLVTTEYAAIQTGTLLEILFVIIFATFVSYFLIPMGQKRIRPTLVSMYSYIQPMVAVIISIITGLDILTWEKVVAMVLVFAGVAIVNRSRAAGQSR